MSRTTQGVKNVSVTLFFYVISMFLSFFSRKIFIDHLGADFMGLSTTVINDLGFLNLAELGLLPLLLPYISRYLIIIKKILMT